MCASGSPLTQWHTQKQKHTHTHTHTHTLWHTHTHTLWHTHTHTTQVHLLRLTSDLTCEYSWSISVWSDSESRSMIYRYQQWTFKYYTWFVLQTHARGCHANLFILVRERRGCPTIREYAHIKRQRKYHAQNRKGQWRRCVFYRSTCRVTSSA